MINSLMQLPIGSENTIKGVLIMLCRNCNYILSGKENFCPNCGTIPISPSEAFPKIKRTADMGKDEAVQTEKELLQRKTPGEIRSVFGTEVNDYALQNERGIFGSGENSEEEAPPQPTQKKKRQLSRVFLLLFLLCGLAVATVGVADHFGVTSVFSGFSRTFEEKTTAAPEPSFSHGETVVVPDINYPMTTAYVFSGSGLALRKGPGNGYSPLYNLTDLTQVQIFGGSLANSNWLYVYCGEKKSYGWLDGSFLCSETVAENELTSEYESEEDVPTAYYSDEY